MDVERRHIGIIYKIMTSLHKFSHTDCNTCVFEKKMGAKILQ